MCEDIDSWRYKNFCIPCIPEEDSPSYPQTILKGEGFGVSRLCSIVQHERIPQHNPTTLQGWNYILPLPEQNLECLFKTARVKNLNLLHENRNVALLDFYDLLAKPPAEFKEWMRKLGYEEYCEDAVIDEIYPLIAFICQKTGRAYYLPNYEVKNKLLRKHKSTLNSSSRFVNNFLELCNVMKADYVIFMTLTAPKEDFNEEKLKKAFKKFIKMLEKELFNSAKLGIAYNVHIWSTKTLQPHYHIHLLFPNCVEKEGRFYRFKPFLDADKLREIWKKALGIDCNPDLHLKYAKIAENRGKIAHWVKYSSRKAIIDIVSYFINNGKEPEISEEWAKTLIEYVNRRVCCGFLRKMSQIIEKSEEKKHYCPVCGGESEKVELMRYNVVEDMLKEGRLLIVYYDPKIRWYRLLYNSYNELSISAMLAYCHKEEG